MTSLANQLKRLALPQTRSLLTGDKDKASLLFDPKEAASLNRDTFYALGVNGLEELIGIDPAFEEFEMTLFDEASKSLERSVQTAEVNKTLDKKISKFLLRLSPYFLLKPAQKSLEWLINRFHIHLYNVDDIMMCIIPYHDTKIFVRMLQLLPISEETNKWNWLHPLQKPGVPLAKSTMVNRCYKDLGFLHFICEMVPKFVKAHRNLSDSKMTTLRVVLSFYATTIVGAIEFADTVSEKLISALLPYILKGLESKVNDYKAASYMIICQLAVKANMKMNLIKPMLRSICKHITLDVSTEAVTCVAIICQTQKVDRLPKSVFRRLCKLAGIIQILEQLSQSYNITPFMKLFIPQLVHASVTETVAMATSSEGEDDASFGPVQFALLLENVVRDVSIELEITDLLVKSLLREFVDFCKEETSRNTSENCEFLKTKLSPIIQATERRFPVSVDKALEETMQEDHDKKDREIVQHFISMAVSGPKYQVVEKCQTSLMLSLNHPSSKVRAMAVKHLKSTIEQGEETDDFLRESLLQRLNDDNPGVVKAVLSLKERLTDVFPGDVLYKSLFELLKKWNANSKQASWWSVGSDVMAILCSRQMIAKAGALKDQCMLTSLPYLYLTNVKYPMLGRQIAEQISTSPLAKQSKILCNLDEAYKSVKTATDKEAMARINHAVIETLARNILKMKEKERATVLEMLSRELTSPTTSARSRYVLMFVGVQLLVIATEDDLKLRTAMMLVQALSQDVKEVVNFEPKRPTVDDDDADSDNDKETESDVLSTYQAHVEVLTILKKKHSKRRGCPESVAVISWFLHHVLIHISVPESMKGQRWWRFDRREEDEGMYSHIMLTLFDLLTSGSADSKRTSSVSSFRNLLKTFIEHHFKEKPRLWNFLSSIWACHSKDRPVASAVVQLRALHVGNASFSNISEADGYPLCGQHSTVVPSLLGVLSCPIQPIRQAASLCLRTIHKSYSNEGQPYMVLIQKLVERREELKADPNHLSQALGVVFSDVGDSYSPATPTPRKKSKSRAKRPAMETTLDWLLDCIVDEETPLHLQRTLLDILADVNNKMILTKLLVVLEKLVDKAELEKKLLQGEALVFNCILRQYTEKTVEVLRNSPSAALLFFRALSLAHGLSPSVVSPQEVVCQQITKEFFTALPADPLKQTLLCKLFDLGLDSQTVDTTTNINKTLKGLRLEAEQIITELNKIHSFTEVTSVKQVKRVKRQEKPSTNTEPITERRDWKRVTMILEFLQHKKKINNCQLLIPSLFNLISKCLDIDTAEQSSVEYIKQLALGCIHGICEKLSPENKPLPKDVLSEEQFNVEMVIQCIRLSDNPQTHHHAMLLLAFAAGLFPEHVLHNIMSIFTFMGANLLRQDDAYSFQVIIKIVVTIIPVLIKASEKETLQDKLGGGTIEDVVAMVIQVFVDALPHIPEHRRLPVFGQLIDTLGANRFLWMVVMLVLVNQVCKKSYLSDALEDKSEVSRDVEFCLAICQHYKPSVQVSSMITILKYLSTLPEDKEDKPQTTTMISRKKTSPGQKSHPIFDVDSHTAKQLRQLKYTVVSFIPHILSSAEFIRQVAELSDNKNSKMKVLYQSLLEENLRYIASLARALEANHNKPTVKFWKALLHRAYDILDKVNALLPRKVFIKVVTGLMKNDITTVRRKALELLNNKLAQQRDPFNHHEVALLLKMIDKLLSAAKATQDVCGDAEEVDVNRQTALYSLKLLCRMIGTEHPQQFKPAIEVVTQIFTNQATNSQVAASALLCLAELCSILKAHCIPYLARFMPPLLDALDSHEQRSSNDLFLLSAVTALHKVVEGLPHFLSPYLLDILTKVAVLSSMETDESSPLSLRLKAICQKLSSTVSARVLLPCITQCYHSIYETNARSIGPLMCVLRDSITSMQKEDLIAHQTSILNLFLTAFDYRTSHAQASFEEVSSIEGDVIQAFLALVIKSSEATFKPLFFKLYDWATHTDTAKDRLLTFYRLTDNIADRLKGLFTLFAGHIIKHSASLLDENNTSKTDELFFGEDESSEVKSVLLLQYVIDCLHKCFLYDTEGFVNRERFECLMKPLVDQIENLQGGAEAYQERIASHLTQCIGQLAVAAGDDSSWKPLNYQVLLKTRSDSAKVRFAALTVLQEIHHRLKEDFQILVPETIPFLAELLEDENEEVEKQCRIVMEEIGKTFGESLQKYF
ncbi:HEAT repeat-containing protein 1-like [Ptychodera flava]|uniref:HEAT repeat-containing protein 1-like n=1 Tax=Ptychodera flava TaxID=63121 RepID=UPI00396A3DE6